MKSVEIVNKSIISFGILLIMSCGILVSSSKEWEIKNCSNNNTEFDYLGEVISKKSVQWNLKFSINSRNDAEVYIKLIDEEGVVRTVDIKEKGTKEMNMDWYAKTCRIYYKTRCEKQPDLLIQVMM